MCQFRSGVAVKVGDDVELKLLKGVDSHSEIRVHYHIRDGVNAGATRQTPLEFYPTHDLLDFKSYCLEFDAGRPDWWTGAMTRSVKRQFVADLRRIFADGVKLDWLGSLHLSRLIRLPVKAKLSTEGNMNLGSLPDLPANVRLSAGNCLCLDSLVGIALGVRLRARIYYDGDAWHKSSRAFRRAAKVKT